MIKYRDMETTRTDARLVCVKATVSFIKAPSEAKDCRTCRCPSLQLSKSRVHCKYMQYNNLPACLAGARRQPMCQALDISAFTFLYLALEDIEC